jgi:hypothetical protein
MNRRGIMGAILGAGVAGPSIAKEAVRVAQESIDKAKTERKYGPVNYTGFSETVGMKPEEESSFDVSDKKGWFGLLKNAAFRAEYESELYEQSRRCPLQLDADLENLRAVSPMMKIVYQRQRHVKDVIEKGFYNRSYTAREVSLKDIIMKYTGIKQILGFW